MYRHIDCALLAVPAFEALLDNTFTLFAGAETVRPHRFDLCDGAWTGCTAAQAVYDDAASQALRRAAPALARFDVCLLPVRPASLAWTRVALACAHGALPVPLVVLACGLSAPALRDLLRLGAAEFAPESTPPDELRLRLLRCATSRKATPASMPVLAEPRRMPAMSIDHPAGARIGRPPPPPQAFDLALRQLCAPEPTHDSFRETRAQVMADFERDYVTSMLMRYRGNVTHAARAGSQDRRAFWQLMRKYSILSADFRSG